MIERILAQLAGELWALDRRVLAKLREVIDRRATGAKLSERSLRRAQSFCHTASMNALTNVAATCGFIAFP